MKYIIEFTGRESGAIGIRSQYTREVDAGSEEAATLKLYEHFEHISVTKISTLPTEVTYIPTKDGGHNSREANEAYRKTSDENNARWRASLKEEV